MEDDIVDVWFDELFMELLVRAFEFVPFSGLYVSSPINVNEEMNYFLIQYIKTFVFFDTWIVLYDRIILLCSVQCKESMVRNDG